MKKYLSLILAVMMVLSCVSYAAPVAVGTVQSANEADVEVSELFEADLAEETADLQADSQYGQLVYNLDLEAGENEGGVYSNGGEVKTGWQRYQQVFRNSSDTEFKGFDTQMYFLNYNGNDKLYVVDDSTGNKVFKFDSHYKWSRLNLVAGAAESFYPAGDYTLVYDIWVDEKYDWSTSHLTQLSTGVAFSGTGAATTLSNPSAKLMNGTNKITNTIRFRTVANTTNRFQIMQDAVWKNTETVTDNVSSSTFTYYLDNIKLYYQGPATVTFSSSVEAELPTAITNVLPGTKLDLLTYETVAKDEKYGFVGWSLEDGTIVTELEVLKDTTLYAVYKEHEKIVDETKGQLVYWLDFDTDSKVKGSTYPYYSVTNKYLIAPSTMPAAKNLSVCAYNAGGDYVENGAMTFAQGFPRFYLSTDAENPFPEGYYTVVWGAKTDVDVKNVLAVCGSTEYPNEVGRGVTLTVGAAEYIESVSGFKYVNGKASGSSLAVDNLGGLQKIGLYLSLSKDTTDNRKLNRYVDYIKVYYTPFYDVTYDSNGKDIKNTVIENCDVFNPAKALVLPTTDRARFVGWSTTPNGEPLTESRVFGKDTTLYAVWDENFEPSAAEADAGYLLANLHFNGKSNADNTNSRIFNYGTLGKNEYVDASNGANAFPRVATLNGGGIWFDGSATVGDAASKFLYDEKHNDNEYVKTASKTSGAEVYPKIGVVLHSGGSLADGVYTVASEVYIPAGQENVASATYNAYVSVNGDKSAVKNNMSIGERVYVVDSIMVLNGKVYDPETMEERGTFTPGTNLVSKLGLNFNVKTVDSSKPTSVTVYADNFKIYYKPYTGAPKSYKENSIRVINPAGIRFKASVSEIERSNDSLTEYGFVVTRKILLDNAGIAVNDFTFESDVVKVPGKSYDKAANIDKIFETNKNETFFTAVVYNIPAQAYKDDIVVRPYVKYGDNYVYGDAMVRNIYDVAVQLKASADAEKYGEALDKIINGEEL